MSFFPAYDRCTRCQARRLSHADGFCPTMPGQRWSSSPVPECGHSVQLAPGCDQCDDKRREMTLGVPAPRHEASVLSDVGRPQICPTCGGGSVYARHLAMEGRGCRHATRGTMVIAWYCGERERQRVKFDNDLPANVTGATISGWNGEILESVKSLAEACKRDVRDCVEDMTAAMEHIRDLEKQLADKVTTRAYEKTLIARGRREDRNAARRAKRKAAK